MTDIVRVTEKFHETPCEYARRRANETRRAYLVSAMGHAMVDDALNRALLDDLGGLAERVEPARRAEA